MISPLKISRKIKPFNKKITIDGDKSLSIRWALLASQAVGKSRAYKLLKSQDVLNTLNSLKKLGVKIRLKDRYYEILGKGLNSYKYKNNLTLDAGNSGTLGRLILGLLVHSKKKIKIIGDKSLSKRDFSRVIKPLKKFGAKLYSYNKNKLPISIIGSKFIKPINYIENKGSAQCKSSIMLAALNTPGTTYIKAKKSRNHTELLFKYLKVPIKIKKTKEYDFIEIKGKKKIQSFNYTIPSDISSSAFFIVLTALSNNSKLLIKNVNINPSRTGIIKIIKKMGVKIIIKNKKNYKGELVADIFVESSKNLKSINCPPNLNSSAIDEFLIIFLVAARANGNSYFKNLSELNQKESPRLIWGSKILNMMGIKTELTNHSIKIYGSPKLNLTKTIKIKNYLKDHRIFMMSTIAGLTCGGKWEIHDPDSINTSFPSFLKIIKKLNKKKYEKKKYEKKIRIAIDSPAAAGAGTQAKLISKHYNLFYLDTGKIYRLLANIKLNQPLKYNHNFIKKKMNKLTMRDLQNKKLLSDEVGTIASIISKDKKIRKLVHEFQKKSAYFPPKRYNGSCLDGRDITYKIIPDANFKFFITANAKTRALRRYKELKSLDKKISFDEVLKSIKKRDKSDYNRKISPLKKTRDSILINTTNLSKRLCFFKIKKIIDKKINI